MTRSLQKLLLDKIDWLDQVRERDDETNVASSAESPVDDSEVDKSEVFWKGARRQLLANHKRLNDLKRLLRERKLGAVGLRR